jgi:ferredoxin
MGMKVKVDETKCIGCGVCVDVAETALEMKDGQSYPIENADLSTTEAQEAVRMAVQVCPVQAISIQE